MEQPEAQQRAADHLGACETAVNIDIGMANDIHPISKDIVGDRLARLALALDYKHNLPYSGPRYQSYLIGPQSVTLAFQFADEAAARAAVNEGFAQGLLHTVTLETVYGHAVKKLQLPENENVVQFYPRRR